MSNAQVDVESIRGVLAAGIGAADTTFALDSAVDAALFPTSNFQVKIDNEIILVGARSGVSFTGLSRGQERTGASSHPKGQGVAYVVGGEAIVAEAGASPNLPTAAEKAALDAASAPSGANAFATVADLPATPNLAAVLAEGDGAGGSKITGLADGSDPQDAATFGQVSGAGVSSIAKESSNPIPLTGDVTLSEGANVTLTQAGQNIEIAAGGGSPPVPVYDSRNGLVKNYDPPGGIDGVVDLVIDPSPYPWRANEEVSNEGSGGGDITIGAYVTPTTNPNGVAFVAQEDGAAESGSTEPTWSTNGLTPVTDGTPTRPLVWTPVGLWGGPWVSGTSFPIGTLVIGNGYAWTSDGGGASGGTEPSWPATPNIGATVSDGAITWTSAGPCTVWAPRTRYAFVPDTPVPASSYSQAKVIPTAAVANTDYVFSGQPTGSFGTTGHTEPTGWAAAMPGDLSVWIDGDIMWNEATAASASSGIVLTGIVAPGSGKAAITVTDPATGGNGITLEDESQVTSDYGVDAESAVGNRLNGGGSNRNIGALAFAQMVYIDGEWRVTASI